MRAETADNGVVVLDGGTWAKGILFALLTPAAFATLAGFMIASPVFGVLALLAYPLVFLWVASLALARVELGEDGVLVRRILRSQEIPWKGVAAVFVRPSSKQFEVWSRDRRRIQVEFPQMIWWYPNKTSTAAATVARDYLRPVADTYGIEFDGRRAVLAPEEQSRRWVRTRWCFPQTVVAIAGFAPPLLLGPLWVMASLT